MAILRLELEFMLPGCRSLKEKRSRLRSWSDQTGRQANIAITESRWHDQHDRSAWTLVLTGGSRSVLESLATKTLTLAETTVDGYLTQQHTDWLE